VRIFVAVLVVIAGVCAAIGGAYFLAVRATDRAEQTQARTERAAQRALCPAFALITARPVPYPTDPAANPSRVQLWQWYVTFRHIERDYHC
jgi:hypothetical protein